MQCPPEMITTAERRYPVRIWIGLPPGGLGRHYAQMTAWLDENCGAASETRGVLNGAILLYFADPTLAGAFVALWCVGSKVETAGGVFRVRDDDEARVSTGAHKTP